MILIRLVEAGRLEWDVLRRLSQVEGELAHFRSRRRIAEWRHREPLHLFGNRDVRTILDAMNADRVSLNKASGFLDNIKVSDVRKLEAHVAGL